MVVIVRMVGQIRIRRKVKGSRPRPTAPSEDDIAMIERLEALRRRQE